MVTSILVLVVFWFTVIKMWSEYGAKLPLLFITLWIVGFFVVPLLNFGGFSFVIYEVCLTVPLLLIERYKAYSSNSVF